ncbi:hypothetical protein ACF8PD_14670 [Vibrio plantisponsor]|uniref:hypothetical protein n=1 Tax=Vibrio plantisponsor TaxID=664643 RepID=UPI00370B3ED3
MSVAIQSFETACHKPCPDMPCYSLDAEQKAKGLVALQKARSYVKEVQLERLRKQHKELTAEANREDTTTQRKMRISEELKRINTQAQRVSERWS